jgi:hypothetical protein
MVPLCLPISMWWQALIRRSRKRCWLLAVEDMIADRRGQHEIAKGDTAMLEQARALFTLAQDLDATYLRRRISEDGGNPAHLGISEDP